MPTAFSKFQVRQIEDESLVSVVQVSSRDVRIDVHDAFQIKSALFSCSREGTGNWAAAASRSRLLLHWGGKVKG